MKRPTFFHGVVLAGLLGVAGSAFVAAFLPFLGTVTVARLVVPGMALAYVLYLLSRSDQRTGRVTILALWSVTAVAAWLFVSSFTFYLLIHAGTIWLIRSLYYYSGIVPSLLDFTLSGFAAVFALGTLHRTGSVFLAVWAFFLVQALFVAIPASLRRRQAAPAAADDAFDRSRRQAEAALAQLAAR